MDLGEILKVYYGSDGEATKTLYSRLDTLGPAGAVALNLFRAHKNSARAKVYRGGIRGEGSFRRMAYDRKRYAMDNLARVLGEHAEALGISWGWGVDDTQEHHSAVLYIDTPKGQVSFHTEKRGPGPDYPHEWDHSRDEGAGRICRWILDLLGAEA